MRNSIYLPVLLIIIFSCNRIGIDNPEISIEELTDHVSFLASDSLKGRKPGTPEGRIAANYIAAQLKNFGYEMLAEDGLQFFDVITEIVAGENNSLTANGIQGKMDEDFRPFSFSSNNTIEAEVVFCGFGFDINKEGLSWTDYSGVDVKDKWVMILRADPELDNDNSGFIPYAGDRDKVLAAKDRGAAGVLLVSGVEYDKRDQLAKLELDQLGTNSGIPAFHIKRSLANQILENSGRKIEDLEAEIIRTMKPMSFNCAVTVSGSTEIEYRKVQTQNVIGFMEGSDPVLKEEIVLFGGHYDHLGSGGPGSSSRVPDETGIHYGADDNASGVAAVVEIAEKIAANRGSLKRSVIVMAFAAEELGLLGSKYFTNNPLTDLDKVVAMVNLDMIGRLKDSREILVGGTGTSAESEELLKGLLKDRDLKLAMSPNGFGPSDHAAFYVEDIPVFFFSTGAHEDYHTPRDVVERVNFEGLKDIGDYVYDLGYELVNMDNALAFQESGAKYNEIPRRRSGVTMRFMPSHTQTEENGLGVDGVIPGGPADLGGILKGDRIVAIEGKPVANIYDYMARMSKLNFGQTIAVDIIREEEKMVLLIQLEDK